VSVSLRPPRPKTAICGSTTKIESYSQVAFE
jgi:hypothetical protein